MLTDPLAIKRRILTLKSMVRNLEREITFAHPVAKITPKGRRVGSVKIQIDSHKDEIVLLEKRLKDIERKKKELK